MSFDPRIPEDKGLWLIGNAIALYKEGNLFGLRRFRKYNSNVFRTKLHQPCVFVRGQEWVNKFYDTSLFQRQGALPGFVRERIFGKTVLQNMDGEVHMYRRRIFLRVLDNDGLYRILESFCNHWDHLVLNATHINVMKDAQLVLFKTACDFLQLPMTAFPLTEDKAKQLAHDCWTLVFSIGNPLSSSYKRARKHMHEWLSPMVRYVRAIQLYNSPLGAFCESELSDDEIVDELINIVRPIVAIANFITFAIYALWKHPDWKRAVTEDNNARLFAQEVRRFFPFAPVMGAIAKETFTHDNVTIYKGELVVLDLNATNHDPASFDSPDIFDPFQVRDKEDKIVAQGGGPAFEGHRCPGEPVTVAVLTEVVIHMSQQDWTVLPSRHNTFDPTDIPCQVHSGLNLRMNQGNTTD